MSFFRWVIPGAAVVICIFGVKAGCAQTYQVQWERKSSAKGELPVPGTSRQQTGDLAARLDPDSPATDFVISARLPGPALVWYRRKLDGWDRYVIEKDSLTIESGGAAQDIDGDGDLDIVFGEDRWGGNLYWWENPYPDFDPDVPWKRHLIKEGGPHQHHDQVFGDFEGLGRPQLVFWNQMAGTLDLAHIPADPRHTAPWPFEPIFSWNAAEGTKDAALNAEGLDAYDIDGDGMVDLLAGNYWFKYLGDGKFKAIKIGVIGGRIRAGRFKPGKYPQIVIAPGDETGPLMMYECPDNADPAESTSWTGHRLIDRDLIRGHTLEIADIDRDGNLDILTAEQGKWTLDPTPMDNPDATAWILYGDGKGNFRTTILDHGEGWHDGRIADFDGDGDLDILQKPYALNSPRVDIWLNKGTGHVQPWERKTAASYRLGRFEGPVGMELWTYRRELQRDLPGTLATIRNLGIVEVETSSFYGQTASAFREYLESAKLSCVSIVVPYQRMHDAIGTVIADALTVGATYVIVSNIPRTGDLNEEETHAAAKDFNTWGKELRLRGLQFAYHPHGFEFGHTETATLFDELVQETIPDLVSFELDTFWFRQGGVDPARFIEKYPNRFHLLHLKDIAVGTKQDQSGGAPDTSSVVLGRGQLHWKEILRAARNAGVREYFIEDESPEAAKQVLESMRYLGQIQF
jgi:sugar phosphate isomerase/epimerase